MNYILDAVSQSVQCIKYRFLNILLKEIERIVTMRPQSMYQIFGGSVGRKTGFCSPMRCCNWIASGMSCFSAVRKKSAIGATIWRPAPDRPSIIACIMPLYVQYSTVQNLHTERKSTLCNAQRGIIERSTG